MQDDPFETTRLVRCAQEGDRLAFDTLYRDFGRVVHGILMARCGAGDADDLTQEVFLHAFERLRELRDPAAFPAWLCAAARNAGVDHVRRRQRRPAASQLHELADREVPAAEAMVHRETLAKVLDCVRRLPDAYREVLVLRLVEGFTGPAIAARTGLTHGSVRVNLTRGMAMLRPLLQESGLP